jgi:hypothetical protein
VPSSVVKDEVRRRVADLQVAFAALVVAQHAPDVARPDLPGEQAAASRIRSPRPIQDLLQHALFRAYPGSGEQRGVQARDGVALAARLRRRG